MSLPYDQQESFEESRDKRKQFLNMVRNDLRISQDELQQNKTLLQSSFESKRNRHRDSPNQTESFSQKLKPPKSPWQGNSSEKLSSKLRELQNSGGKNQFRQVFEEIQDNFLEENGRTNGNSRKNSQFGTNLENILELSRIDEMWAFDGSSKMSSQNFTPLKRVTAKSPSVRNGECRSEAITQKEHKKRLDHELVSLETRMIEFFEKEKKNILKENMNHITKVENKMKEKYNSVVKDILETKSRESSFSAERVSQDDIQNRDSRSNTPQKENTNVLEKRSPAINYNQSTFANSSAGANRFLVKSPEEFAQAMREIKLNLSYDQDGDYVEIINENKSITPNKNEEKLVTEIENNKIEMNKMAEKIKELEMENETLRKRASLMEYLLKSDAEKKISGNESPEKPNYDKFITPKMRDYVSRMSSPAKQTEREKQGITSSETKDLIAVKDFGLDSDSRNEDRMLIKELREQINDLNGKITTLEKINKNLMEKEVRLRGKEQIAKESERKSEEKLNQHENQVDFWKKRCEALTTKYFDVIKKLKADNEKWKEELFVELKDIKKLTLKQLHQIQGAYQEKVGLLYTRLKQIEAHSKNSSNKNSRSNSSRGKDYF